MKHKQKLYSIALASTSMVLFLILFSSMALASYSAQNTSPAGTNVYTPNEARNTVSVIDTATNKVTATVNVGHHPSKVAISPDRTKVYVANSGSDTVSVIDAASNTVTATVDIGASPYDVVVNPEGTMVYVTSRVTRVGYYVYVIDTTTHIVIGKVAL